MYIVNSGHCHSQTILKPSSIFHQNPLKQVLLLLWCLEISDQLSLILVTCVSMVGSHLLEHGQHVGDYTSKATLKSSYSLRVSGNSWSPFPNPWIFGGGGPSLLQVFLLAGNHSHSEFTGAWAVSCPETLFHSTPHPTPYSSSYSLSASILQCSVSHECP